MVMAAFNVAQPAPMRAAVVYGVDLPATAVATTGPVSVAARMPTIKVVAKTSMLACFVFS